MRSAQSVVARNAMPPPGDYTVTERRRRQERRRAGDAPHPVVVLQATSASLERDQSLSTREQIASERGGEDGGGEILSRSARQSRAACPVSCEGVGF